MKLKLPCLFTKWVEHVRNCVPSKKASEKFCKLVWQKKKLATCEQKLLGYLTL